MSQHSSIPHKGCCLHFSPQKQTGSESERIKCAQVDQKLDGPHTEMACDSKPKFPDPHAKNAHESPIHSEHEEMTMAEDGNEADDKKSLQIVRQSRSSRKYRKRL